MAAIGIDPFVLQNFTLTPSVKRGPIDGIAVGTPLVYSFKQGQPLPSTLTPFSPDSNAPMSPVEPNNGFVTFPWQNGQQLSAGLAFGDTYDCVDTTVTFAFKIRVNGTLPGQNTLIGLAGVFWLAWNDDSSPLNGFSYTDNANENFAQSSRWKGEGLHCASAAGESS